MKQSDQKPKFCSKCGQALVPSIVVVQPPPPKYDIYTGEQTNLPELERKEGAIECPNLARMGGMRHDWWAWSERRQVWTN